MLGTAVGDSESYEFWARVPRHATSPGPVGVHLMISDAHAGLKAAVAQQPAGLHCSGAGYILRANLHTAVSAKYAAAVKTIFAHTDPEEVAAQ